MTSTTTSTVPAGSTDTWRDKKRYLWLIGLVVPSLAFIGYGVWAATGLGAFFWIGPVRDPGGRPGDRPASSGSTAPTRPTT